MSAWSRGSFEIGWKSFKREAVRGGGRAAAGVEVRLRRASKAEGPDTRITAIAAGDEPELSANMVSAW